MAEFTELPAGCKVEAMYRCSCKKNKYIGKHGEKYRADVNKKFFAEKKLEKIDNWGPKNSWLSLLVVYWDLQCRSYSDGDVDSAWQNLLT